MAASPIGQGPVVWTWQLSQGASVLAASGGYRVVTDSWVAVAGDGAMWLKGKTNLLVNESSGGTGQINVNAPPHYDYPIDSERQYHVGSGTYLAVGGNQTLLAVWLSTNGLFFFREGGVPSGEDFGDNYTVAEGDRLAFEFSLAITEAAGPM